MRRPAGSENSQAEHASRKWHRSCRRWCEFSAAAFGLSRVEAQTRGTLAPAWLGTPQTQTCGAHSRLQHSLGSIGTPWTIDRARHTVQGLTMPPLGQRGEAQNRSVPRTVGLALAARPAESSILRARTGLHRGRPASLGAVVWRWALAKPPAAARHSHVGMGTGKRTGARACSKVFEHVNSPSEASCECHSALRSQGLQQPCTLRHLHSRAKMRRAC